MDISSTRSNPPISRIGRVSGTDARIRPLIDRMLAVSIRGLSDMFDDATGVFVHSTRADDRLGAPTVNVGRSLRYTAIALLGIQYLSEQEQRSVLCGKLAEEWCKQHLQDLTRIENVGDVALFAWLSSELGLSESEDVLEDLARRLNKLASIPTIEFAWCLIAFALGRHESAHPTAQRLLANANLQVGAFAHEVGGTAGIRRHVGSFADQVYPIQALATYAQTFNVGEALRAANSCASMICSLQGREGQWWWHYDVRTGRVVEGYPVYSVHQDAMGPMALFALQEAGGTDHTPAIVNGLWWMERAPEIGRSLIDDELGLIWRKVARREPAKLSRRIRAVSSRLHPSFRLHWLNRFLPPVSIDYECRPYHLGWVLYTWLKFGR